jgi:hypothetical protein
MIHGAAPPDAVAWLWMSGGAGTDIEPKPYEAELRHCPALLADGIDLSVVSLRGEQTR